MVQHSKETSFQHLKLFAETESMCLLLKKILQDT